MKPVKTEASNLTYRGPTADIGDLPCERRDVGDGTAIYSTWELEDWERKLVAEGHNIEIGIWHCEPIPPISVGTTPARATNAASDV